MATLTKTTIKKKVRDLLEELSTLKLKMEELKEDIENESAEIEPYGDCYELTPQQEERQEWLDNVASELEYLIDYMEYDSLTEACEIEVD